MSITEFASSAVSSHAAMVAARTISRAERSSLLRTFVRADEQRSEIRVEVMTPTRSGVQVCESLGVRTAE